MRTSIATVVFVLGLQGFALPAAAADEPPMTNRAMSEMSQGSLDRANNSAASTQQTRVAEASTEKNTLERSVADDSKDSGRSKPVRIYFFFGGR